MLQPEIHFGQDGKPLSGVGRGIGLVFVETYFPEAKHAIRIASGYFQIGGYEMSRIHIGQDVQLQILVSKGEGKNVTDTLTHLVQELLQELGQTSLPLCDAVEDIIRRIERNQFVIRGAWETQNSRRFHCKFYIMDDECLWSGSANFTRPGLSAIGNEEQATLSRDADEIRMFTGFYDKVISKSDDLLRALYDCLKTWLGMADPFDAYLKVLHYWYRQEEFSVGPGGHTPTYFQSAIVTRAVQQIRASHGALLLIATGLGKTIIGAETARRVTTPYIYKRILILAPKGVKNQWQDELRGRSLPYDYFDNSLLFRSESPGRQHQITHLLACLERCDETTFIVIDEAHRYRKMLQTDVALERHNKFSSETKLNLVKERMRKAVDKGAKLLLLTATPYGTDRQNINSLLHLLPEPQKVQSLNELKKLSTVTIFGMLHLLKMACDRGDIEPNGRIFIAMKGSPSKKYLPKKIILYREEFTLIMEAKVQAAFAAHIFESNAMPVDVFNEEDNRNESVVTDTVQKSAIDAWLSSAADFKRITLRYSNTSGTRQERPDGGQMEMTELFPIPEEAGFRNDPVEEDNPDNREYTAEYAPEFPHEPKFKTSLKVRRETLQPLLLELEREKPETEDKFVRLQHILGFHIQQQHKVVVFVNRYTTAVSLSDTFRKTNTNLRVGCTVHQEGGDYALKSAGQREDVIQHFCPRSSGAKNIAEAEETDVLICTDADGVGINMQDACVVVNYDLPSGADELFQRAGRVLRMTEDPDRIVHLYTFEPALLDSTTPVAANISRRIKKLRDRHNNSRDLVGGSILPDAGDPGVPFEVPLASLQDIISLPNNITLPEEWLQNEPDPVLTHVSTLERNSDKASALPIVMLSARSTQHHEALVFVLLRHDSHLYPVLYNVENKKLLTTTVEKALELILCDATEQKAVISPQVVERKAIEAVEAWCQEMQRDPVECEHLCTIYLKPRSSQEQDMKSMLSRKA